MGYQLRTAIEADYQFCYDLTKQNMFGLFSRHWGGWEPSVFRRDFNAKNVTVIAIAQHNVGFFSLKTAEEELYLENIQLSPSFQGQGIGTAVLQNILQSNPRKPIRLTTFSDNPVMRLYQKLGFEITEQERETVRMIAYTDSI